MNDSEWLAEPEAVTREDRIRALERMVMVARPEFRPGRVPPMARALATIAATLLDHERRLSHEAPTATAPQCAQAELLAIQSVVLAFVAACMANGLSVEVEPGIVTAVSPHRRRAFTWTWIATSPTPLHRLADELRREFTAAPAVPQ